MGFILFAELEDGVFDGLFLDQMSAYVHALYDGFASRDEGFARVGLVFLFSTRDNYPFLESILHLEAQY